MARAQTSHLMAGGDHGGPELNAQRCGQIGCDFESHGHREERQPSCIVEGTYNPLCRAVGRDATYLT